MKNLKNIFALFAWLLISSLLYIACKDEDFFHTPDKQMEFTYPLDSTSEYIVVIGDIQNYTYHADLARTQFKQTMDWIYAMYRKGYQIDAILQTGDLTNDDEKWQYEVFEYYTQDIAEQVLYVPIVGNHDYTWGENSIISDHHSTRFSNYTTFENTQNNIVSYYENGRMENIIVKAMVHGRPLYIIAIEFGPRPDVLQWASAFVAQHPDEDFLLMTHEYLSRKGERLNDSNSDGIRQFGTSPASSPETIWRELIYPNDNIRCVLCGHNGFAQRLFSKNEAGRMVPQLLFNIQYLPNGGDGYVQIWELPKEGNIVNVSTISTFSNTVYSDSIDDVFNGERANYSFDF